MFCAVFVRFGEPYAAHIDKDVAQTLLEILNYPHLCHIQSFRHLSQFHLKKHCQNYRYVYLKELQYQLYFSVEYLLRNIFFSSTATSRILAIVFTLSIRIEYKRVRSRFHGNQIFCSKQTHME